jgi:hypothetical protein
MPRLLLSSRVFWRTAKPNPSSESCRDFQWPDQNTRPSICGSYLSRRWYQTVKSASRSRFHRYADRRSVNTLVEKMSDTTRRIEPELTIALCGDIMLGAEVAECMGAVPVTKWLEGVSKAWSGADLLIANLESPCVLHATPNASAGPTRVFHAPARRLAELAEAGFSALTLANNHILNCGPLGLRETMQGLDQVGIAHAGAGMTLAEALQPTLIRTQGITIGLVAFCYGPPASRSSPGVAPTIRIRCAKRSLRRASRQTSSSRCYTTALSTRTSLPPEYERGFASLLNKVPISWSGIIRMCCRAWSGTAVCQLRTASEILSSTVPSRT